jgi:rhodanese-related sulfurtransferase
MLLDVRTKEEVEIKSVGGAVNIPLDQIIGGKVPDVSKNTEIKVFCESGGRAQLAVSILKQKGFLNAINVGGLYDL